MITQKQVKEYLDYNPDTGIFKWKVDRGNTVKHNDIAGTLKDTNYICISINNKKYFAHRLAWLYTYGEFPKEQIDHINRIRNDNRICNLRDVNQQINCRNISMQINNTSGHKGVSWYKRVDKWVSYIVIDRKYLSLGYFDSIDDAILSRENAEEKYW